MTSHEAPSHIYVEVWNEILEAFIKPGVIGEVTTSDPAPGLTPRLRKYLNDENLSSFLCGVVISDLEAHCKGNVLPKLLELIGVDLISHAYNSCLEELHFTVINILKPLMALEHKYLEASRSESHYSFLVVASFEVFRKTVYNKIADPLRNAAYECISDSFKIERKMALNDYLNLIRFFARYDIEFAEEEWNTFAYSRLVDKMSDSFKLRRKPFQDFLQCAENLLVSSRTIFQLSEGEYERNIKQVLLMIRDDMIFGNDAEEFKMILEDGDGKMLNQIIDTFKDDKEFLNNVTHHASGVFSDLVHGKGQIINEDWLKKEKIFHRLFSQWLRLKKTLKHGDRNKQTIQETLIMPFLTVINSTFPDSDAIARVLLEYCGQLFSKIYQRQVEFQPDGITKINALLSLSHCLSSAGPFHEFFRVLLSKTLLEGTSAPLRTNQLPTRRSLGDQTDILSDIFGMLDDANTWPLYEKEMSSMVESFKRMYGRIDVEPKIVRRSRWDLEPDIGLVLPHKIQSLSQHILDHLYFWHPMRCASLHSSSGTMTIRTHFWTVCGQIVRIKLTTAQGCVLKLFEEKDELRVSDVAKSVLSNRYKPSNFNAVVAVVKSMMSEHAILSKKPQDSKFRKTDIICLNKQFQPEEKLITLPGPEYSDENPNNMRAALTNVMTRYHKMALEAAVMKVLKQEQEVELHRLEGLICSHLGLKGSMSTVGFGEVIERLARDEYLTVDKTIVRYVN